MVNETRSAPGPVAVSRWRCAQLDEDALGLLFGVVEDPKDEAQRNFTDTDSGR